MRILSLDVGESRIGVAVSDPTGTIASPVTTIRRVALERDLDSIVRLVQELSAVLVVVGLPRTLRGEIGPQAERVMRFAERLSARVPVPLEYWDETYSTQEAEDILATRSKRRRRRGGDTIDDVAAAVILQGYLDGHGGRG